MHVEWTPELYESLLRMAALTNTILKDGEHEDVSCMDEWRPALEHIFSRASLFGHADAVSYNRKTDSYSARPSFVEKDEVISHAIQSYDDSTEESAVLSYATKALALLRANGSDDEKTLERAFHEADMLVEEDYKKGGVPAVLVRFVQGLMDEMNLEKDTGKGKRS